MRGMRYPAGVSLAVLGFTLAACGGGGVNSTPTPSPPPTPAPSPPPTYSTVSEVMAAPGDKSFQTAGFSLIGKGDPTVVPLGNQFKLEYIAASNSYRVTRAGSEPVSFDAASGSGSIGNSLEFETPGGDKLYLLTPHINGVPLTYTRTLTFWKSGNQAGVPDTNLAVFGVLTKDGDLPKSGTASYAMAISGAWTSQAIYLLDGEASGTFSADFSNGTVSTSIDLKGKLLGSGTLDTFGTIGGTGAIASIGSGFSGNLLGIGADGPEGTGIFSGAFFGPQAAEMGYAWYFGGTTWGGQGYASGKKN